MPKALLLPCRVLLVTSTVVVRLEQQAYRACRIVVEAAASDSHIVEEVPGCIRTAGEAAAGMRTAPDVGWAVARSRR